MFSLHLFLLAGDDYICCRYYYRRRSHDHSVWLAGWLTGCVSVFMAGSVCPCVCLPVYLSVCLSLYLAGCMSTCMYACLCVCLSAYLSDRVSVCLCVYLSLYQSVYRSVFESVKEAVCLTVTLSVFVSVKRYSFHLHKSHSLTPCSVTYALLLDGGRGGVGVEGKFVPSTATTHSRRIRQQGLCAEIGYSVIWTQLKYTLYCTVRYDTKYSSSHCGVGLHFAWKRFASSIDTDIRTHCYRAVQNLKRTRSWSCGSAYW